MERKTPEADSLSIKDPGIEEEEFKGAALSLLLL